VTVSVRRRAARLVAALVVFVTGWLPAGLVGIAAAQETPRSGGELVFVVPAESPSFDAHREESFALIHPAAPHYSTLLRVDPDDPSGTKLVGDLAESWSSAANGRTWTLKIRRGVKFHDGGRADGARREGLVRQDRLSRLSGWTITSSHFLNNQLDAVWLAPE
jgi:peptide/nickel transport system substrate-binding protein